MTDTMTPLALKTSITRQRKAVEAAKAGVRDAQAVLASAKAKLEELEKMGGDDDGES